MDLISYSEVQTNIPAVLLRYPINYNRITEHFYATHKEYNMRFSFLLTQSNNETKKDNSIHHGPHKYINKRNIDRPHLCRREINAQFSDLNFYFGTRKIRHFRKIIQTTTL